jgi:transposase
MDELLRMEYPNQELVIDRSRLFYALMTFDEKKQDKELTPHLGMICEKYPVCELIRSTYKEFHDIIIVDKDINQRTPEKCEKAVKNLHAFIEKHKDDEVLKGFASGLKGDINCVINAICRRESSGGVEGRNTKYKQTLRDCYGHVQMETLEQKLKLGFMYTEKDFSFDKIAPWLMQEPFAAESA